VVEKINRGGNIIPLGAGMEVVIWSPEYSVTPQLAMVGAGTDMNTDVMTTTYNFVQPASFTYISRELFLFHNGIRQSPLPRKTYTMDVKCRR
jgi:hypothetical protein